ncbi:MAG: polysaccharide deacetylase family protein, partial [Elusimicrobia bacterium]|nr:polysaccharide deacetylase family protein [Elusimicrobiota bacterium]MBD3412420.1 polysaccharide deacetylase family protein [Elusimicrobiota bacterium]
NNYNTAVPLLEQYGFKAIFFIVSESIGRDNFWHDPATEPRIPMMNEEELKRLIDRGHEIGSHTLHHPNLARSDRTRVFEEVNQSKKHLEKRLKCSIVSFAYPYGAGAHEPAIVDTVRAAGYRFACSIRQGLAHLSHEPYTLKRLLIRGDDGWFDFYLNITRGRARL